MDTNSTQSDSDAMASAIERDRSQIAFFTSQIRAARVAVTTSPLAETVEKLRSAATAIDSARTPNDRVTAIEAAEAVIASLETSP